MIQISASILSANLSKLEHEIEMVSNAGADMIHIDVMDGHFVPNLTFGSILIKAIRRCTNLPLDVHLMINNPEKSLKQYENIGVDIITVHPETVSHLDLLMSDIKSMGIKTSVALLPTTSFDIIEYIIDKLDVIMVMSVNPGFDKQIFIRKQLIKIAKLNKYLLDLGVRDKIKISVDGGVNEDIAKECIVAGVDIIVSGSYIFSGDYSKRIRSLKNNN